MMMRTHHCMSPPQTLLTKQLSFKLGRSAPCSRFALSHGQMSLDRRTGDITLCHYVFIGDFIDRGACSLETICVLMSLKVRYPSRITLIRGEAPAIGGSAISALCCGAEAEGMPVLICTAADVSRQPRRSEHQHAGASIALQLHSMIERAPPATVSSNLAWVQYGFRDECIERCGEEGAEVWERVNNVFDWLPLAACECARGSLFLSTSSWRFMLKPRLSIAPVGDSGGGFQQRCAEPPSVDCAQASKSRSSACMVGLANTSSRCVGRSRLLQTARTLRSCICPPTSRRRSWTRAVNQVSPAPHVSFHGLSQVDEIRRIQRPLVLGGGHTEMTPTLWDILWSDPTEDDTVTGIHANLQVCSPALGGCSSVLLRSRSIGQHAEAPGRVGGLQRGAGGNICKYGPDRVKDFCTRNDLKLIIRAHECVQVRSTTRRPAAAVSVSSRQPWPRALRVLSLRRGCAAASTAVPLAVC